MSGGGNFHEYYNRRSNSSMNASLLGEPPNRISREGRRGGGGGEPYNPFETNRSGNSGGGRRDDFSNNNNMRRRSDEPSRSTSAWAVEPNKNMYPNPKAMGNQFGSQQQQHHQQQQQQPQMVMILPQGQGANSNIMQPFQSQNPFIQQQGGMRVIQLPAAAFNNDAFGQQIIQAAAAGNFGGGGGGGGMNQQYGNHVGRDHRDSDRSSSSRVQRSSLDGGRSSRRYESNKSSSGQRGGYSSSSRGPARKRLGRDSDVDRKRPRRDDGKVARNVGVAAGRVNKNVGGGVKRNIQGQGQGKDKDNKKEKKDTKVVGVKEKEDKDKVVKAADDKDEKDGEKKDDDVKIVEGEDKDSVKEDEGASTDEKKEKKKSKYDEFPASLLVCKICQKSMNDGASFESHLSGRAHLSLVKILEERFTKRSELLMQESKLGEEEIGIEMDRQRRAGKAGHNNKNNKNFCKMCDCQYTVNWGAHKISIPHRVLKEFLHPNCRFCNAQFVHRMDWVNHLYSLGHLRKIQEMKKDGDDVDEHECSNQEELFSVTIDLGKDETPINPITIRSPNYKLARPGKDDMKEMLKGENGEMIIPEDGEIIIPKDFDANVAVGENTIINVAGWCCKVCRKYIPSESDVQAHLKSKQHFGVYTAFLKKIVKLREEEKKAKEDAEKAKSEVVIIEEVGENNENEKVVETIGEIVLESSSQKQDSKDCEIIVNGGPKDKDAPAAETEKKEETTATAAAVGEEDKTKTKDDSIVKPDDDIEMTDVTNDKEMENGNDEDQHEEANGVGTETKKEEAVVEEVKTPKKNATPVKNQNRGGRGSPASAKRGTPFYRGGGGGQQNRGKRGGGGQQQQTPRGGGGGGGQRGNVARRGFPAGGRGRGGQRGGRH